MTKEQVLQALKEYVLTLRDHPDKLNQCHKKALELQEAVKGLNSCDADWVNDQYGPWHRKNILPHVDPKVIEKFNKAT